MSQHLPTRAGFRALVVYACLAGVGTAHATTLARYVSDAVQAAPQVHEQVHAYRQVLQDHEIALSGWRPSLDLSASTSLISKQAPSSVDFSSGRVDVTLTQNLFNGFDTTNQIEQAKARISSAVFQLFDTADNAALDAVRAYVDVLTERKLMQLAHQNVVSHERIFAQILEQSGAGIGRRSEIEQTEGRLASAKANLVSQQNNLQDALTQFHKVLGRYADPGGLDDPRVPAMPAGTLEELIDQSLSAHPALESAQKNIEAAHFDYRRSQRNDLPQLDLQLQQSAGDDVGGVTGAHNERSVQLSLKYNLYRGGADAAQKKKKISALNENRAFRKRVQRQVIDTLRLAWMADRALNEQLPFLHLHVEKAQETVTLYEEEFFLQKRDLLDLLDAESELNSARKRETESYYLSVIARYRVYEGLGRLFEPLGLTVEATDDDLRIANLHAKGIDSTHTDPDGDRDGMDSDHDQCDNSLPAGKVNAFGCETTVEPEFGYLSDNGDPVAGADELSTPANAALDISPDTLLANDTDPEGDQLRITKHDEPNSGSVMADAEGFFIYAPHKDFRGTDEFSYTVEDGRGGSSTAKIVIRVGLQGTSGGHDKASAVKDPAATAETQKTDGNALEYLRFGYKQAGLTPASEAILDVYTSQLQTFPAATVEIRAYTDDIGSNEYNRRLSTRRAERIKTILMKRGIADHRITALGMGEHSPIASNETEEGRAQNRRAELNLKLPLQD